MYIGDTAGHHKYVSSYEYIEDILRENPLEFLGANILV